MAKNLTKTIVVIKAIFVGLFVFMQSSFAQEITETRDLTGFDRIRIDNMGIELEIFAGEDFEVEIEGSEVNVQSLRTKVSKNQLVIYPIDDKKRWGRRGNSGLSVVIRMPKFTGLDLRGAVDAEIEGVNSEEIEFDIKGAGNIEVEGTCGTLTIDFKGAGNLEADDLECKIVDVDLKGAGKIEVYASEEVNAEISGMGTIEVDGSPKKVTKDDGFFSHIRIH